MPFKIVQTIEPGRKVPSLSVVPAAWEKDNILYWPNSKKLSHIKTLIEDGESKPMDGWLMQDCVKKRDNLLSYAAAELEVEEMTRCTDSEAELIADTASTKRQMKRKELSEFDYTDMVERKFSQHLSLHRSATNTNQVSTLAATSAVKMPISNELPQTVSKMTNGNLDIYSTTSATEIYQEIDDVIQAENVTQLQAVSNEVSYNLFDNESVKTIITNQHTIMERQDKMIKELAVHKTMLEFILQRDNNEIRGTSSIPQSDEKEEIFPLTSTDDVHKFEINLLDATFKTKVINHLSKICGTTGKLKGVDCCYILMDKIFSREVLTKYSWAGGSRNVENKLSFKSLHNIRNTFYQIILKADHDVSEVEVENFFKGVIKNAKRRFELVSLNKQKRASRSKNRPSKLTYKKLNDELQHDGNSNVNEEVPEGEDVLEGDEEISDHGC